MKICSIIILCTFRHALNFSETKYFYFTLENKYEIMYEKYDNSIYYSFVKNNFKDYVDHLTNLETISSTDTSPENEFNCPFMIKTMNLFYFPIYMHLKCSFLLYEERITRFLKPKIYKILKKFNKSIITFDELKRTIIKIVEKEIDDIKLQTFVPEICRSWSSDNFFRAFYKKGLISEEEPSIPNLHGARSHPQSKILKSLLKDEISYKFIKINENETIKDVFEVLYALINVKGKDLTLNKIFIYINLDLSLLVLDYFLVLKNEFENLQFSKEIFLLKLVNYIQEISVQIDTNDYKIFLREYLHSKNHIKLHFTSDVFCFFYEYLNIYYNNFFNDNSVMRHSFDVMIAQCKSLCYQVRKININ